MILAQSGQIDDGCGGAYLKRRSISELIRVAILGATRKETL
jgi:hypothetical protein